VRLYDADGATPAREAGGASDPNDQRRCRCRACDVRLLDDWTPKAAALIWDALPFENAQVKIERWE